MRTKMQRLAQRLRLRWPIGGLGRLEKTRAGHSEQQLSSGPQILRSIIPFARAAALAAWSELIAARSERDSGRWRDIHHNRHRARNRAFARRAAAGLCAGRGTGTRMPRLGRARTLRELPSRLWPSKRLTPFASCYLLVEQQASVNLPWLGWLAAELGVWCKRSVANIRSACRGPPEGFLGGFCSPLGPSECGTFLAFVAGTYPLQESCTGNPWQHQPDP